VTKKVFTYSVIPLLLKIHLHVRFYRAFSEFERRMLNRAHFLHRQAEKAARKGNIEEAIQVRGQRVLTKLLKNVIFRKHSSVQLTSPLKLKYFNIQSTWFKLVSTYRSNVLSLPLQFGFPSSFGRVTLSSKWDWLRLVLAANFWSKLTISSLQT